ncbi:MAG: hypothetical protein AB1330_01760 [Bacillota bacterium]
MGLKKIWLVGQYKSGKFPNVVWELQGVFTLKKRALAACVNENCFIVPLELNKAFPEKTVESEDAYYPGFENKSV